MARLALLANLSAKGLLLHDNPERGWELPGGKVEPGESPEEAARREAFEEVGWCPRRLVGSKELDLGGKPATVFASREEPPARLAGCVFAAPPEGLAFGKEEFLAIVDAARRILDAADE